MTHYPHGDDWAVLGHSVTDGDTIRVADVERLEPDGEERRVVGLVVQSFERIRLDPVVFPKGRAVRLVILNTPERGKLQPGGLPDGREGTWAEARADLAEWLGRWKRLRVETWEEPGNFGRWLGDVYVEGRRDLTASEHMLRLGWNSYIPS